jgi:hypothetical protein
MAMAGNPVVEPCEPWLRRLLRLHRQRHRREMGCTGMNALLTDPAVEGKVAIAGQWQGGTPLWDTPLGEPPISIAG